MDNNKDYRESFKEFCKKYGFPIKEFNGKMILTAKCIDENYINWIAYNSINNKISYCGNTDNCNIWFYETRKDFTPEKVINFIADLNNTFELSGEDAFKLRELIDPEDWQEITDINDASEDIRYTIN